MAEADLGDQPLEAGPAVTGRAGTPEVLIDDLDPLPGPAEPEGAIDQAVLQLGALLIKASLARALR